MNAKLQTKLTASHLVVTVMSALLLATLILVGYFVYLQTALPAQWMGDWAFDVADEIGYMADDQGGVLDESLARFFVSAYLDVDVADVEPDPQFELNPEWQDWLIVTDPNGIILGSSYEKRFPVGASIQDDLPPAFKADWLDHEGKTFLLDRAEEWIHYDIQGSHHVGQAAIISENDALLGWVYIRIDEQATSEMLGQTALYLGIGILGAALISVLISGIMGGLLARSFSRRLQMINAASDAFAAGDLDQRVSVDGQDEITQLGRQFNAMADRIGSQMQSLRQLAEKNAQLAEEARGLATLEERNRLARELHDAIKQQLFGLSLTAGSIQPLLSKDPDLARTRLDQLSQLAHEALEEMDHIIKQLRPASLADKGLGLALSELAEQWTEQTGITLDFEVTGERELPIATEQILYRIAQEALNNIARHANAQRVELHLSYDLECVRLRIADDGYGFDPQALRSTSSLGLSSMRERMKEVDGQLDIASQPQRGTVITATVPSEAMEASRA